MRNAKTKFFLICGFIFLSFLNSGCTSKFQSEGQRFQDILHTKIESKHYIIYGNFNIDELVYYKNFCEGFYTYINETFFPLEEGAKATVYLFNDSEFRKYTNSPSGYGYYSPGEEHVVVNIDTGIGTLTHELVHSFTYRVSKNKVNQWGSEGISAFFEKVVGYIDEDNSLVVSVGYYHPRRFRLAKEKIDQFKLDELLNGQKFDKDLANTFMLFMHKNNLFKKYVKARLNSSEEEEQLVKTIFNKPVPAIESEWKNWVRSKRVDREVDLVRASFIGRNQQELENWLTAYNGQLIWDEEKDIYKVR